MDQLRQTIAKLKRIVVSPSLSSIWNWTAGYRKGLFWVSMGNILAALLGLGYSLVIRGMVDNATDIDSKFSITYACSMILIFLLQLLLSYVMGIREVELTARMTHEMREKILAATLNKKYEELSGYHSAEMASRMMRDTSTVTAGVVEIIPSLLCLATQFTGAFFILLKLDYVLVLVIVILGMLAAFLVFFLGNKTKRFHKEAREKEDQIESTTQEMLRNLRVVKAAGIEHKALSAVRQRQNAYFGIQSLRNRYVKRTNVVVTGVFMVSEGFAVIWGCIRIYTGAMSYGTMAALLGLVGQIQGPISGLSHYIAQAYAAISSAERLDEILALPEDEIPAVNAEERVRYQQMQEAQTTDLYARLLEIDIDHISFTYGRDTIFRDASLKLYPGEIMAITGHSGIGKSTFFLLLLGLYLPGEGSIRFAINEYHAGSGKGIMYYEPTQMRRLFSYVPQGNVLFSGTIRENISMFRELVTEEEILQAAKLACIDEFILSLEDGLDTIIGEDGLGLSEGQAQRIAIARAFLSNAPILLLDEATSALDDDTECKVLQSIAKMKNKTCLIVTHRMKALEICHRQCRIMDQKLEVL